MKGPRRRRVNGFTVVELLVVITIIVVLLALLMPALDKAVYQAELSACGAKIRATGGAATLYAAGNARFYPYHAFSDVYAIAAGSETCRPVLRTILAINPTLNDPLTSKALDLDQSTANYVGVSYPLWFGWGYANDQRMSKLGDRWTYTSSSGPMGFSLLASDYVTGQLAAGVPVSSGWVNSIHQDAGYSLRGEYYDDEIPPGAGGLALPTGSTYTFSRWTGAYMATTRFDFNYGYDDGSVRRVGDMRLDGKDERVVTVAWWSSKQNSDTAAGYLPRE